MIEFRQVVDRYLPTATFCAKDFGRRCGSPLRHCSQIAYKVTPNRIWPLWTDHQLPTYGKPAKDFGLTSIMDTKGFAVAVIDALVSQLCVVDRHGTIVAVNRAWLNFKSENSTGPQASDIGSHYLGICRSAIGPGSDEGEPFAFGLASVLAGKTALFELEYPCHSPSEHRWFLGRVTPLKAELGGAVISHLNITDRKLMEIELARLAATDPLTGIPNRRFFIQTSTLELERLRRFGGAASVIMVDVDHFKMVNDSYGHAVGDEALRLISETCSASIRLMDVLARHGGEEFVILLPGTGETDACRVAEKLRIAVCQTTVRHGSHVIRLSASFGVTELRTSDQSIDAALVRADTALYAAKRFGRNCVRSFTTVSCEAGKLSA